MNDRRTIRVLPDLLVNKIAAGEVVERPASVVKELCENALDAGATRIALTIEEGGRRLIRVTDNGGGMTPEDLRLAVTPHATSKIASEEDLYDISTMGFRGEALASISAVSRLRIVSRPAKAIAAHEIQICAERVESAQATGAPAGTTVEVRDLFFNVPARRKFLRTNATEVGHINEQVARLALAHPSVGFEVRNNNRVSLQLPEGQSRLDRIAKCYSPELASAMLRVERMERGVTLEAYLAPPAHSRANAQWQYVFVNGRYVRDRFAQHAIKEAYRGLIEHQRHPVVFVFLAVDPRTVDVNVHPTKLEVRWADSGLIHSQVLSALRETLQRADLAPDLRLGRASSPGVSIEEQDRIRREMAEALKSASPLGGSSPPAFASAGSPISPGAGRADESWPGRIPGDGTPDGQGLTGSDAWRRLYAPPESRGDLGFARATPDDPSAGAIHSQTDPSKVVQMHNLYLVAESDDGIIIIDQHALHERVMYEELTRRIAEGPLESQRLLLPETIRVTAGQMATLDGQSELLAKLGIEVSPFGEDSVAVQSFPVLLKDADVAGFMRDLIDLLSNREPPPSTEVVIHKILDMMACKAAVKSGDPLSEEEIRTLIGQKGLIDKSSNCPHGRPTTLRLTRAELDRQFKRT